MRIGSLFSGVGGLELGLEWAGVGRTVWQVEQDAYAKAILAKHWPHARRYDDVRTVGAHNLAPVDVLCGGFPCQDLSLAGRGAGLAGARSGLWFEYLRIARELRPRFIVVENVAALLARGAATVLGGLAALGYGAVWTTLRASDVGAPHRRERLFVVAYADGQRQPKPRGGVSEERGWAGYSGQGVAMSYADGARSEGNVPFASKAPLADAARPRRADSGVDSTRGRVLLHDASHDDLRLLVPPDRRLDSRPVCAVSRATQPRVGRDVDGVPPRLDGSRWPAGRGADQHEWEPTRTAHTVAHRAARLRALGNAVVPQCAYVVGRVLLEIDDALRAEETV